MAHGWFVAFAHSTAFVFCLIASRYTGRVASRLEQLLQTAQKQSALAESLTLKRRDAAAIVTSAGPRRTKLVERTKRLQRCVERVLSEQYKGRPVRITGEINMLGE